MKVKIKDELHYIQWRHVNNVGISDKKVNMFVHVKAEPKPSYTECTLQNAESKQVIAEAKAKLGKHENNFCKETGRVYSLRRLLSQLDLSKSERREIWKTYFYDTNQINIFAKFFKE